MSSSIVTCPSCGLPLNVTDTAPRVITCPSCLAPVRRQRVMPSPVRPIPVVDIESEATADNRVTIVLLLILVLAVATGFIVLLHQRRTNGVIGLWLAVFSLLAAVALFFWSIFGNRRRQFVGYSFEAANQSFTSGDTLDYEGRRPGKAPSHTISFAEQMFLGALLGVLTICASFYTRSWIPIGAIALLAIIGLVWSRTRGFAAGIFSLAAVVLLLASAVTAACAPR